jgi:hypothetical protein
MGEEEAAKFWADNVNTKRFVCDGGIAHEAHFFQWPGLNLLGEALMAARTMLMPR